jgi:hypothetical protein
MRQVFALPIPPDPRRFGPGAGHDSLRHCVYNRYRIQYVPLSQLIRFPSEVIDPLIVAPCQFVVICRFDVNDPEALTPPSLCSVKLPLCCWIEHFNDRFPFGYQLPLKFKLPPPPPPVGHRAQYVPFDH